MDNQPTVTESILKHCKKHGYSQEYTAYWLRNWHCLICGNISAAPHHIITQGAGGTDKERNLLALCTTHHTEIHQIGIQTFGNKYLGTKEAIATAIDREKVGLS